MNPKSRHFERVLRIIGKPLSALIHTNVPPDFVLRVSHDGLKYRAAYKGYNFIMIKYPGQGDTRQDAIDQAWRQYEYDHQQDEAEKWEVVK